ncbi:ATP synthase F1 subunit delta [Petrotoga olearia]|uniref:ATP synthase subunit delta n=2 Tax=Petrotoga olearia TaxID=156203 RepID=A0A2K1P479_9BACT|nr:ATP synthase F1 subunit delta [Petrotoga olearia]KUK16219.1 MAG: ATP synthase subunit delta [Petrotoga mobilis]PNR97582.1 ATP synthase subunit delta [Petrotoga olearia DSM 13574]RMA75311.1 ATP synthase F1 subcomplex delta subunit [Petrotoga olearia]HBT51224.1 ATP synthase F1 subunit delta [Petrotoga sp.]
MKASYFLASKYAQALLNTLEKKGEISRLDEYVEAFQRLKKALDSSETLRDLVYSPLVPTKHIVTRMKEVSEFEDTIFIQFLEALVDKRRQNLIPFMSLILYQESLEREKVVEVRLILPSRTTNKVINQIKQAIHNKTGREIKLVTEFKEDLIGGLQLYIGDKFFDFSVKGFLQNIQSAYAPVGGGENI